MLPYLAHGPDGVMDWARTQPRDRFTFDEDSLHSVNPSPAPDAADLPLFQISKPNPNAGFWSMFYFAYAGHNIPPKRIEFGKIQKNPPGPNGGGTRISITGKSVEEKAVWQTLGEGNEDCVEWVVLCAALNLLE